ncbi:SPOR domain-containing protein [Oceanispirochaeta sp.]|jgi:cell division septation protein DedD|uniref:SPOR domain-containing protein n=1 Tax=Oceanispirochaeta sp. TaxID=2035350 RepID=UPI002620DB4D|nr:SPOR domain-containing protein [Oceanispirochaeta sp.]MDA3955218.1 SPOR domain-containing protein [Oceanispirochaeta sp.]
MDNIKNQSREDNNLKTLWVLFSALGLLIIVGTAGFFFFSPDKQGGEIKPVLAATTLVTQEKVEEFDPIAWSRESDEYPGLEEKSENLIEVEVVSEEPEPVVERPAAVVEAAPVTPKVKTPVYKEVSQLVYWIQVGSYSSMTKAESVRVVLKEKGLTGTVQTKDVNGNTVYRVRIGAFNSKEEAEKFSTQVQALKGYEESFVIQSVQVKKVIVNS